MRLRSWLFLSLGVLLAVLTGVSLNGVAQQSAGRAAAAPPELVSIVVASLDVPARTVLQSAMFARRDYPRELIPNGTVANEVEATGQTTLAMIPRGTPILRSQLTAADGKSGASILIDPGSVLVSFPTTDPLTVGGFVSAGDRVDIL